MVVFPKETVKICCLTAQAFDVRARLLSDFTDCKLLTAGTAKRYTTGHNGTERDTLSGLLKKDGCELTSAMAQAR